jgi:LacI family transcriptional regulator
MSRKTVKRPTIRDVATLAKVGLMTVSRVINQHPSVRDATRQRVQTAITQLGYQQNEAARLLKGRRAMTIGLIVPDVADPFFAICAHTVQQIARSYGYMTLIVSSEKDSALEVQEAELMAARNISGLVVVTSLGNDETAVERLQNTGLVIVALERPLGGMRTDAVLMENHQGARIAVQHLIDHGHRSIACIGYDPDVFTTSERVRGYVETMRAAKLTPKVATGINSLELTREWLNGLRRARRLPTAMFTSNNRVSMFMVRALAEAGLRVPDDVALVGFDDFDLASVLSPPMTVVAQSPIEMVRRAMTLLMERIAAAGDGKDYVPAKIVLPTRLIVRASCGCKPAHTIAVE